MKKLRTECQARSSEDHILEFSLQALWLVNSIARLDRIPIIYADDAPLWKMKTRVSRARSYIPGCSEASARHSKLMRPEYLSIYQFASAVSLYTSAPSQYRVIDAANTWLIGRGASIKIQMIPERIMPRIQLVWRDRATSLSLIFVSGYCEKRSIGTCRHLIPCSSAVCIIGRHWWAAETLYYCRGLSIITGDECMSY